MTLILRSSRLLHSLAGLTRHASSLVGKKKKFIFTNPQRILNFNELRVRNVVLSTENKEEDELYAAEQFEKDFYQLSEDVSRKRVFKEDIEKLLENLKQNKEMKSFQLLLLLECCTENSFMCSEKERIEMAENIWNTAANLGLTLSENHYNALLTVFVRNKHKFSCEDFLNDMEKAGSKPNITTYRKLLRAYCQQGDIADAKNLLKKMKNLNYSINELDFNSLILGYSKIGDFEKANEILKIMTERGIEPGSDSYVFLLCGYIENNKLDEFKEIFNEVYYIKNIDLTSNGLMEIIYTLAINKHESYIDEVLQKLPKNFYFEKLVGNLIQRLLHKKLDSVALKLLQNIDVQGRSFNYGFSISRYLLDHFVYYRKPNEIIHISEELEKNGLARVAVGYSLRKIFSLKDENFAMSFIELMKSKGLPVREHYYWPIIIKTSKKGNEKLMSLLKQVPKSVFRNIEAVENVILPNYKISETYEDDIEKLTKIGIPSEFLGKYFFFKFLGENEIDEAERIVAAYPIYISKITHFFNSLFTFFERKPDKVEQMVNILYNLYHDAYLSYKEILANSTFFDKAVLCLLQKCKDEKIILRVLEGMLEKKMRISSEIVPDIVKALPNQNVEDLVSKLTDPDLKFEFNQDRLKSKDGYNPTSLTECISFMMKMVNDRKLKEAIKLGERFLEKNEDINQKNVTALKPMFRFMIWRAMKEGTQTQIKKFIDFANKLNIFDVNNKRDNGLIILGLLKCNQTSEAIEKFKEILSESGTVVACVELFIKCISEGKTQDVEDITKLISENGNGNKAFTWLVFALASLGEVDKAKKVLDTPGFVFNSKLFLNKLLSVSEKINAEILENCIKILNDVTGFNLGMTILYKMLVKEYAKKKDIKKLQLLCLEIQEKNISDDYFLKQLSEFQKHLDPTLLYDSMNERNLTTHKTRSVNLKSLNQIIEIENSEEKYQIALEGNLQTIEVVDLASQLAFEGEVKKICSLVKIYSIQSHLYKIGRAFLKLDYVEEYFKFIDFLASERMFIGLSDCIRIRGLISILVKNDEYFTKYKSLSIHCAEEANFSKPIISCFVNCVKIPGKLNDAEEILKNYPKYFENITFSQIKRTVERSELSINFYENALSSTKLKNYFADHLPQFYNNVINSYCANNDFDKALNYLNRAIDDKVEKMIDQDLISTLKTKLKSEGKSHPHLEEIHSTK